VQRGRLRPERSSLLRIEAADLGDGNQSCVKFTQCRVGTVDLMVAGESQAGRSKRRSGGSATGDRRPDVEGSGAGVSVLVGGDVIAAEIEEVVDRLVRARKRCACLADLSCFPLALSPPGGLVRVFGPVVQSLVPAVRDRWQEILICGGIAGELVGDHHPRRSPLPLQQLAKQPFGAFASRRL
jgi:hypothetical protein